MLFAICYQSVEQASQFELFTDVGLCYAFGSFSVLTSDEVPKLRYNMTGFVEQEN